MRGFFCNVSFVPGTWHPSKDLSSGEPSRYSKNKVLFTVPCACTCEMDFRNVSFVPGTWHPSKDLSSGEPSRYSKNKVLFTVPCACTCEMDFRNVSFVPGTWHPSKDLSSGEPSRYSKTRYFLLYLACVREGKNICSVLPLLTRHATLLSQEQQSDARECFSMSQYFKLKPKPQGTVKTRYFLLYLARVRVRRAFSSYPLCAH